MCDSFDIQDADTINTLITICKTYLKMNQAIDNGDIEGFQKYSKIYNDLRKTAKFTAAQKKEQKEDFVDCIGNLVSYCEQTGGKIPKYQNDVDNDIIDTVIKDLKAYNKSLIYEDPALAKQIEDYLTQRQIIEAQNLERAKAREENKESIELTDNDFIEFYKQKEADRDKDLQLLKFESGSEFDENEEVL